MSKEVPHTHFVINELGPDNDLKKVICRNPECPLDVTIANPQAFVNMFN